MNKQHTAEPWAVSDEVFDNDGTPETVITGLDGRAAIAVAIDFGPNNPGMREANARRIVASVNYCAKLSTEGMETSNARGETAYETMARVTEQEFRARFSLMSLKQQRDELLRINTLLFQDAYSVYTDACESAGHDPEPMDVWQQKYLRVIDHQAKAKEGA